MYQNRISLSIQDILDKEFKVDARGYRLQEVDKFLDIIIKDYNEFDNIIKSYDRERKNLIAENNALKQEVHNLKSSISAIKSGEKEITNVDLIRRISQLEKIIFGKEEQKYYLDKRCIINCRVKSTLALSAMIVVIVLREQIT